MARMHLSASSTCFLLSSALPFTTGATVTFTPVAVFSTFVVVWLVSRFMPALVYSLASAADTSSSSTGRMRGSISTTVTLVP